MTLYIGLMSGTSIDGVDAVLLEIDKEQLRLLNHHYLPFSESLRLSILSLCVSGFDEIERSGKVSVLLAECYAQVVLDLLEACSLRASDIRAIGVHGQTVRHRPKAGFSLQLNHPALLAELTGIDVIADFRSRDVAAQGEGAPLVPAFHQAVFSCSHPRAILNIGGISNLTLLPPKGAPLPVRGFDCGPGNMLIDLWCTQHLGLPFDQDGQWARRGTLHTMLLSECLSEPYFALDIPKSTGRELFSKSWLDEKLAVFDSISAPDVARTLVELTALSITEALERHAPETQEVFVCGGGVFNGFLMQRLATLRAQSSWASTSALHMDPMQVESAAFAWLAHCFCERHPGNLPAVTHAKGPRILGALYPAQ